MMDTGGIGRQSSCSRLTYDALRIKAHTGHLSPRVQGIGFCDEADNLWSDRLPPCYRRRDLPLATRTSVDFTIASTSSPSFNARSSTASLVMTDVSVLVETSLIFTWDVTAPDFTSTTFARSLFRALSLYPTSSHASL